MDSYKDILKRELQSQDFRFLFSLLKYADESNGLGTVKYELFEQSLTQTIFYEMDPRQ